ncbi:MFS transporter [Dongshaea marina]|uniref:MFS transporter n=1 Tax=Dongshaea marina TaxID=2047966 RepID=UPI001900A011|nr:MFS transporter [Dongshaea marina]
MMVRSSISVIRITLVVALGGLLFGYDTAVISGATQSLQSYFKLDATALGFAAASALLGCIIGAILASGLSSRFGR